MKSTNAAVAFCPARVFARDAAPRYLLSHRTANANATFIHVISALSFRSSCLRLKKSQRHPVRGKISRADRNDDFSGSFPWKGAAGVAGASLRADLGGSRWHGRNLRKSGIRYDAPRFELANDSRFRL
ncbi:hypothetical protein PUN28_012215 [Cardiocondyla obscurior]|uniref:Uncharacterized protein n=1 Tax=Cardiocondyla obscurior TaxID=286306 RepID=A0AAW2FCK0_9HYME